MKDVLSFMRSVAVILICGFGVAGTSRGMHREPVSPYYAQLATQQFKYENNIKQAILRGHDYVGAAFK